MSLIRVALVLMAGILLAIAFHLPVVAFERGLRLTDQDGRLVTDRDLAGAPYAIFFGFTHCPEICPTALFELSQVLEEIGPQTGGLKVLFVTVDPERDAAADLKSYLSSFDPRIRGLRGSPEETANAAASFKVTYKRVPQPSGDYTMEHTALIFLVGPDGKLADHIDYRAPHEEQVAKFRALLGGGTR